MLHGERKILAEKLANLRKFRQFIASAIRAVSFLLSQDLSNSFMIVSINLHVCIHFGSKGGLGGL